MCFQGFRMVGDFGGPQQKRKKRAVKFIIQTTWAMFFPKLKLGHDARAPTSCISIMYVHVCIQGVQAHTSLYVYNGAAPPKNELAINLGCVRFRFPCLVGIIIPIGWVRSFSVLIDW